MVEMVGACRSESGPAAGNRLTADELRQWAYHCVDGLTERCDEINDINVFPIADSDTGTNLVFTVRAAVESMRAVGPDAGVGAVTAALARGAVSGARGNSGVIVSQVMRALAEIATRTVLDGDGLRRVLQHAARLAGGVVSVPVEGTIVTVLESTSQAVDLLRADADMHEVVRCAVDAAADAVERTRAQLPVLDAAGVVDAGALGLLVMLDSLAAVVTDDVISRPRHHRTVVPSRSDVPRGSVSGLGGAARADTIGYEVLYRVSDISEADANDLRRALNELGDSVVVAGDGAGTWAAHVHTAQAGLAVEAGLPLGRMRDVRISAIVGGAISGLSTEADTSALDTAPEANGAHSRGILAVIAGGGAAELYDAEGAEVLRCDTARVGTAELCAAITGSVHHEVLVLPNGALSAHELVSVSIASRAAGKEVLMLPSSSMVQGLAALAVHDPTRAAVDDAFAMSEAASATRWASLRIADQRSLTWVGTCEPGNGLGLVGPEVVVIGPDVVAAGRDLLDQLLSVGGEMVTMLRGAGGLRELDDVADTLAAYVADRHPGVEVVVYTGGQPGDVLQLGVE